MGPIEPPELWNWARKGASREPTGRKGLLEALPVAPGKVKGGSRKGLGAPLRASIGLPGGGGAPIRGGWDASRDASDQPEWVLKLKFVLRSHPRRSISNLKLSTSLKCAIVK